MRRMHSYWVYGRFRRYKVATAELGTQAGEPQIVLRHVASARLVLQANIVMQKRSFSVGFCHAFTQSRSNVIGSEVSGSFELTQGHVVCLAPLYWDFEREVPRKINFCHNRECKVASSASYGGVGIQVRRWGGIRTSLPCCFSCGSCVDAFKGTRAQGAFAHTDGRSYVGLRRGNSADRVGSALVNFQFSEPPSAHKRCSIVQQPEATALTALCCSPTFTKYSDNWHILAVSVSGEDCSGGVGLGGDASECNRGN